MRHPISNAQSRRHALLPKSRRLLFTASVTPDQRDQPGTEYEPPLSIH
jgi:hypothetical protein